MESDVDTGTNAAQFWDIGTPVSNHTKDDCNYS